jgi:hypothetical protein
MASNDSVEPITTEGQLDAITDLKTQCESLKTQYKTANDLHSVAQDINDKQAEEKYNNEAMNLRTQYDRALSNLNVLERERDIPLTKNDLDD